MLSAWNPVALENMALPPCHVSAQFYVEEDEHAIKHISCHMYQRSVDCFLGLPFNMLSYAVLTSILGTLCDMKPRELIITTGDTHIYKNHLEQVREQMSRDSYPPPSLYIDPRIKHVPIEQWTIDDFHINEYVCHSPLKAPMSV